MEGGGQVGKQTEDDELGGAVAEGRDGKGEERLRMCLYILRKSGASVSAAREPVRRWNFRPWMTMCDFDGWVLWVPQIFVVPDRIQGVGDVDSMHVI